MLHDICDFVLGFGIKSSLKIYWGERLKKKKKEKKNKEKNKEVCRET